MPRSTYELIGEIINPRPRALPDRRESISIQPHVPLSALIGWIIGPPGGRVTADTGAARRVSPGTPPSGSEARPMPLPPF